MLEAVVADIRRALRSMARMPGLAAVVVLSLGIGIGVNTTVFSWIQALVMRPLPGVENASGVYLIEPRAETGSYPGASWREYRDLQEQLPSFTAIFAARMAPFNIGEPGRPERRFGLLVSGNYFAALGLHPARGRLIRPDDASVPGGAAVVVISHAFWQSHLDASESAVGRTVRVNDRPFTVIGVTPDGFEGTAPSMTFDLFLPATMAPVVVAGSRELDSRGSRGYSVMGRLRPGVTAAQAQADVDAAMRQLARDHPDTNAALTAEVLPFWKAPRGPRQFLIGALAVLQAIMLILLLAICGNTANLMFARAAARTREIGMRLALGAGRARIVSLMLTESLLLSVLGAALGVAIAYWGTDALRSDIVPLTRTLPIKIVTSIDAMSLLAASALGIGAGMAFGLAPALRLARLRPQLSLRSGGSTPARSRARDRIMAVQVALATIVLVASGLFLRSFLDTRSTDPGFRREGVLLAAYDLRGRNTAAPDGREFATLVLDRLRALPAVESAAIASSVPLDIHGLPIRLFSLEGRARPDGRPDQALANTVTPGYFATMGIAIVAGADFVGLTDTGRAPEAVVNEEFVRRFVRDAEPLGRRIEIGARRFAIAGIVRNSLYESFREPPTPIIYFSYRDVAAAQGEIHLRTRTGSEMLVANEVRRVVSEIDAELPVFNVRTLSEHVEANLFMQRIPARMFVVLGPLILVLATIGIYAVVAYTASLRTTEIGVRLALGATPARVVAQFVADHLRVIGWGVVAGWLLAFVVVAEVDVTIFVAVPIVLLLVATAACWVPARRASRVDPLVALRAE